MEVVICRAASDMAELAAEAVEALLDRKPHAVLGLATGSSPLALYKEMVNRHRNSGLSFAQAKAFALDEYIGLSPDHPQLYRRVLESEIATRVDFAPDALTCPDGAVADPAQACADYERAIQQSGGIDLQVLGIGTDGHIGFNEPGSSLGSRTRVKTLTRQTREDNARFFGGDVDAVPRHVITQGLATICDASHLVLLATGAAKARAVAHLVEGAVTSLWPATILQHHPHVTVLLDEAAAADLQLAAYYRETYAHKPPWQAL